MTRTKLTNARDFQRGQIEHVIREFSVFQEGIPPKINDLSLQTLLLEDDLKAFNDALKTIDQRSMKEVDDTNARVDWRGEEIKEIDDVMKNLVGKISKLEDRMLILEQDGLEQEDMVALLQAKVDSLQLKICHYNEVTSRLLSGSGSREDPFTLEYAEENEYHPALVVTSLVPIEVEEERDPSRASQFGDDEEEDSVIEEAVESSEDEEVPQENEVPLPIHLASLLPTYAPSVCSSQRCKRSCGALKTISYHPYRCADTFMGMPAGLRSTKDLRRNLERLRRTGSSHKRDSARSGLSSSDTSFGVVTDRLVDLRSGRDAGSITRHSVSPEV